MTEELHSTPWPKRPDGTNKTMGEMTADEQKAQWKASSERVRRQFVDRDTPVFQLAKGTDR